VVTFDAEAGMAPFQILPAERGFYDWFEKGAATARDSARLLASLLQNYHDAEGRVLQITELEHQGDFVVHETLNLLSRTFITPLEGDEIRALVSAVDDVTDWIEDAADALLLYDVQTPIPEVQTLARLLLESTEQMVLAMPMLREKKNLPRIKAYTVEINRLENEADRVLRNGLTRLVRERSDWFEFMRWKEILEKVEEATDKCEDVADVLEAVATKNA
jgi:predicted phosphate transport protein (TIGR00153 family)